VGVSVCFIVFHLRDEDDLTPVFDTISNLNGKGDDGRGDSYDPGRCSIYDTIVMPPPQTNSETIIDSQEEDELDGTELMNPSQITIRSSSAPLSLIWVPLGMLLHLRARNEAYWYLSHAGTGKPMVVVQIPCASFRTVRFS